MNSSKELVPWKCHICHAEYDLHGGGVCSRCSHATCRAHLNRIGQKTKLESEWICDGCLTEEERKVIKKRWFSKLNNLSLKRIEAKIRRAHKLAVK